MRAVVLSLVLGCVLAVGLPAIAGADGPRYVAPVAGPIVDPWRPPAGPFGAGNRGVDFAAAAGDEVRASASGEVVFAGSIGGATHVVVLHGDGLRTTYAFLAGATVRRGQHVVQGAVVGIAAGPVHFGVRAGDRYLDPTALLAGTVEVHLVPERDRSPLGERGEGNAVAAFVRGVYRGGAAVVGWAVDRTVDAGAFVWFVSEWAFRTNWSFVQAELERIGKLAVLLAYYTALPYEWLSVLRRMSAYRADQHGCTPRSVTPPRPSERRIAVLVGGLGSDSGDAAIDELDTAVLGYGDGDVARFSYRGGQVDEGRGVEGVPRSAYGKDDTSVDLGASAHRLRGLIEDIRVAHPGVPIDVIGHSQGGVIARAALVGVEPADPRFATVENLVTIGAPHHGTDAATALVWAGTSSSGALTIAGAGAITGVDPGEATGQLSEKSRFIDELNRGSLPADVRFTSIGSSGDLVVPAVHSAVDEAVNSLVPDPPGLLVHDRLPGSGEVEREVALALAGMGPTCRSVTGAFLQSFAASATEDTLGAGIGGLGHYADGRVRVPGPSRLPPDDPVGR